MRFLKPLQLSSAIDLFELSKERIEQICSVCFSFYKQLIIFMLNFVNGEGENRYWNSLCARIQFIDTFLWREKKNINFVAFEWILMKLTDIFNAKTFHWNERFLCLKLHLHPNYFQSKAKWHTTNWWLC